MNNNDQVKNAEKEAVILLNQAMALAKASMSNNEHEIIRALDSNLKLWVYIKTLASDEKNPLPRETKGNLIKLADYVSSRTLEVGKNVDNLNQKALDCMIMTNLQISEGLMSKRPAC